MLKLAVGIFAETSVNIAAVAALIGISLVVGGIVGVICPRRPEWPYVVSAIVGLVVYHVPLWWDADPNVWQWRDPITSEVYQFGPAIFLGAAPAMLGTLIVRRILSWYHANSI